MNFKSLFIIQLLLLVDAWSLSYSHLYTKDRQTEVIHGAGRREKTESEYTEGRCSVQIYGTLEPSGASKPRITK